MDLKQLKAILKLMRTEGVLSLKTADVDIQMSPEALLPKSLPTNNQPTAEVPSDNPYVNFPDGMLSPEQLAFYSSGGDPSEDPENSGN